MKYDHYRKCPWKDINNNCCTWRVYHNTQNPWYECCDDENCLGTEALQITFPPVKIKPEEDGTARYFLVLPYCHRKDFGASAKNYSGVNRLESVCGYNTCFASENNNYCTDELNNIRNNIDCYHYYYGGWGQPYNYGRMHWPQINQ